MDPIFFAWHVLMNFYSPERNYRESRWVEMDAEATSTSHPNTPCHRADGNTKNHRRPRPKPLLFVCIYYLLLIYRMIYYPILWRTYNTPLYGSHHEKNSKNGMSLTQGFVHVVRSRKKFPKQAEKLPECQGGWKLSYQKNGRFRHWIFQSYLVDQIKAWQDEGYEGFWLSPKDIGKTISRKMQENSGFLYGIKWDIR